MLQKSTIKTGKIAIALLLVFATNLSMGSFTGTVGEQSKEKYSLKNFNKNFYKKASPFTLTAGYQFKGVEIVNQKADITGINYNTMLRYEKGNTTYIYPYKHKVSVPLFKTPTQPSLR
jgi:hypothetical protein